MKKGQYTEEQANALVEAQNTRLAAAQAPLRVGIIEYKTYDIVLVPLDQKEAFDALPHADRAAFQQTKIAEFNQTALSPQDREMLAANFHALNNPQQQQ